MDDEYERVILVKPEIFVYRIPPRTSNRAYKAADWKLDNPDWTGRLRIVSKGINCIIKLEDKTSGELYAACPVDSYPGAAVEGVSDSARYFVIRLKDESGRSAFIGIGFYDRSDSFDFNVALQDHFKHVKQAQEQANQPLSLDNDKKLDLRFKEGQTFTLNIGKKQDAETNSATKPRARPAGNSSMNILLPPPPGTSRQNQTITLPKPTSMQSTSQPKPTQSNIDLLLDLDTGSSSTQTTNQSNNNWVQF